MTALDVLREHAGKRPAAEIAELAGVSLSWIYQLASANGISLRGRQRKADAYLAPQPDSMDGFLRRPA